MPDERKKTTKASTILRIVLFGILAVLIVAWFVDRRSRNQAQAAYDQVTQLDVSSSQPPTRDEVQQRIGRKPAETREAYGGLIEEYRFTAGLPWRSYRVLVAYVEGPGSKMRYLEHFLNDIDDPSRLRRAMQGPAASPS